MDLALATSAKFAAVTVLRIFWSTTFTESRDFWVMPCRGAISRMWRAANMSPAAYLAGSVALSTLDHSLETRS